METETCARLVRVAGIYLTNSPLSTLSEPATDLEFHQPIRGDADEIGNERQLTAPALVFRKV